MIGSEIRNQKSLNTNRSVTEFRSNTNRKWFGRTTRERTCKLLLYQTVQKASTVPNLVPFSCFWTKKYTVIRLSTSGTLSSWGRMDPEEGSTPTAQWAASPSWWVGDDLRSDDGNRDEHLPLAAPARSSDIRRSSHLAAAASEEGAPHRPRDSRRMFGDLPNSSLDPDVLGDPIQRELERRAAGPDVIQREPAEATVAIGPRIVTFADSTRQPGAALSGNGTNSHGFWQIECSRLQGQIASLAREKER